MNRIHPDDLRAIVAAIQTISPGHLTDATVRMALENADSLIALMPAPQPAPEPVKIYFRSLADEDPGPEPEPLCESYERIVRALAAGVRVPSLPGVHEYARYHPDTHTLIVPERVTRTLLAGLEPAVDWQARAEKAERAAELELRRADLLERQVVKAEAEAADLRAKLEKAEAALSEANEQRVKMIRLCDGYKARVAELEVWASGAESALALSEQNAEREREGFNARFRELLDRHDEERDAARREERERLRDWTSHGDDCKFLDMQGHGCTCGLDAALEGGEK